MSWAVTRSGAGSVALMKFGTYGREKKSLKGAFISQAAVIHRHFVPSLNVAITLSLKPHPVGQNPKKARK